MSHLLLFNKPYRCLCQFSRDGDRPCLADFISIPDIYPAGRLDHDSEGLLLLSDDGALIHRITDPQHKLPKTYWAQVERIPNDSALQRLRDGLELKDGRTRPAQARLIDQAASLWPREPPIRERQSIPTAWLELTIREGRNRQVRRMCAAIGHPCLRLIRARIGDWSLDDLQPGQHRWCSLYVHHRPRSSGQERRLS